MNELTEIALNGVTGGGDLPIGSYYTGPSESEIAALLALLTHPFPTHQSD